MQQAGVLWTGDKNEHKCYFMSKRWIFVETLEVLGIAITAYFS
jgi:hypothetical protein